MNAVRFNFSFDAQQLAAELHRISPSFQTIVSNSTEDGKLKGMHLITAATDSDDLAPERTYKATSELEQCPCLSSVLAFFDCDKFNYRVHNLKAKGKITLHKDHGKSLKDGVVRIHIPVTTNEEVHFYVDGERIPMQNGECWLADIGKPHEVENRSNEDRLQLMIDCYLNDWWRTVLANHGVPLKMPSKWSGFSLEALQTIRLSLLQTGLPAEMPGLREIESAISERE